MRDKDTSRFAGSFIQTLRGVGNAMESTVGAEWTMSENLFSKISGGVSPGVSGILIHCNYPMHWMRFQLGKILLIWRRRFLNFFLFSFSGFLLQYRLRFLSLSTFKGKGA